MAKNGKEVLEELGKKYRSNLFDKNGELQWNSIDHTMKSWLEIGGTYLEKCAGYGSGAADILCVGTSLDDIISEYGEASWETMAAKDGGIVRFDPYDRDNTIDKYVCDKYSLKSRAQIQEILDTSIDELDLGSISLNAADALKDNGINTVDDIVKLEPNELFTKMQDAFGPELENDAAALTAGAVMEAGLAWNNGKFVYNEWKENGKYKFHEALVSSLQDNVITPDEADKLSEIAEKYGLSKEYRETVVSNYVENQHSVFGKPRPVIAHPVYPKDALLFADCFNKNKYEVEKKAAEDIPGKPVPCFNNMDTELAENILETLYTDGGYEVYGDLSRNKLWLRDEQTEETSETNFNQLLAKTKMITESWHRDGTTVNENKFIKKLDSLETDNILVPVDVRYKFKIPEEIKIDSEKAERRLREGIENAIRQAFYEPSEMVHGSITTSDGNREADYTFRHNLACSKETNYSNLNFNEIDGQLQYSVGTSLNDAFGLDHKILFSKLKSFVPEKFFLGLRQVVVNKETIEKFAKTPEEYSSEATDEMLKTSGVAREQIEAIFKEQKKAFDKVLLRNPLLKEYVEEQWKIIKEKAREHGQTIDSYVKKVEKQCGGDKSVRNILVKAAAVMKTLSTEEIGALRKEFSKSNLNSKKQIENYLKKKISPVRKIERAKERRIEREREI